MKRKRLKKMSGNVDRRDILKGFVVAYLSFSVPQVLAFDKRDNINQLMIAMQSEEAILKLGEKFLQDNPNYRDISLVEQELENLLTLHEFSTNRIFKDSVRSAIKEDFLQNKIVSVEGWQFSKTETFLAVLTVLTQN